MSLNAKSFYGGDTGKHVRLRRRLEAAEAGVRSNSVLRYTVSLKVTLSGWPN